MVLLDALTALVKKREREKYKAPVTQSEVAGAVITAYVLHHAEDILESITDAAEQAIVAEALQSHRVRTGLPPVPISPEVTAPIAFPSFEQLLRHEAGVELHPLVQLSETKPPSNTTVFDSLLGGDLNVLVQDAQKEPERYSSQEKSLLGELAAGQKNVKALTETDGRLLTQAVMSFATLRLPKPKPPTVKTPPVQRRRKPALMTYEDELQDGRAPQVEMPGGTMTAYWWAS